MGFMNKLMGKKSRKNKDSSKKTVRVMYSDPYATESSSEDDEQCNVQGYQFVPVKKVFVTEIETSGNQMQDESYPYGGSTSANTNRFYHNNECEGSSTKYKGVYHRKSGRYAAQIYKPFGGREWLGTFDTAEEASDAYQRRRLELDNTEVDLQRKSDDQDLELLNRRFENSCLTETNNHYQYECQSYNSYGYFDNSLATSTANETFPYEASTSLYHQYPISSSGFDLPYDMAGYGSCVQPLSEEDYSMWN